MNSLVCFRSASRLRSSCSKGFTYLSLLILIAIIGITSATAIQAGSILQRREAEEELLNIGAEFRNALISYANATPIGQNRMPMSLQDLLKDPRYPNPRRHLRKLYADPITGKPEWGLVQLQNGGGIIGVYSLSQDKPIKIGNFDTEFQDFADKESYSEWKFLSMPQMNRAALFPNNQNQQPRSTDAGSGSQ